MNNQKLENLLNLALDADENERERSEILDVGYDPIEKEWELIVKYSGDIDMIRPLVVDMTVLLNEYMIVTFRECPGESRIWGRGLCSVPPRTEAFPPE